MRVASKIVLLALLSFLPVLGVYGWFSLEREEELFRSDMERDLSLLGAHLAKVAAAEWVRGGVEGVASIVGAAVVADKQVAVEWHAHEANEATPARALSVREGSLVWIEPVYANGQPLGAILLEESLAPMHAYLRETLARFGLLTVLLITLSVLTVHLLSRRFIGQRLKRLVAYAARTGEGDLGRPVHLRGRDEIADLASSLSAMSAQLADARHQEELANGERLLMLQHLRHADRLASVGRLAAGVAHELGTPLNVVLGHANRIAEGAQAPVETKESAETIHRQVKRMEQTIRDILGFVRKTPSQHELINIRDLAETVSGLLAPLAKQKQVTLDIDPGQGEMRSYGDGLRLEQALSNLVTNAIDASPDGGGVKIKITRETRSPRAGGREQSVVLVRVRDEGAGVPESEVEHLFEPFFTSKATGQGTGLGLWLADGILRDHGGRIELESPSGQGACFAMVLPEAAV